MTELVGKFVKKAVYFPAADPVDSDVLSRIREPVEISFEEVIANGVQADTFASKYADWIPPEYSGVMDSSSAVLLKSSSFKDRPFGKFLKITKVAARAAKDGEIEDVMSQIYLDSPNSFGDSLSRQDLKPLYIVRDKQKQAIGFAGARPGGAQGTKKNELVVGIMPHVRGQGHGIWAARELMKRHPEVKDWTIRGNMDEKFPKRLGFTRQGAAGEQADYSKTSKGDDERHILEQMAFKEGAHKKAVVADQVARHVVGGALGAGATALENKYLLGDDIPPEIKRVNLLLGTLTGGMAAHPNPQIATSALASWPLKSTGILGVGALLKNIQTQRQLSGTNLDTAKLNYDAARDPLKKILLGAGVVGGAGMGAYGIHRILQDIREEAATRLRPAGTVRIALPHGPGGAAPIVDVPFDNLPPSLYKQLLRDTKRHVRQEGLGGVHHRNGTVKRSSVVIPVSFLKASVIREEDGGYVVHSEKGKKLSRVYDSKAEAHHRLGQIEYFKKHKSAVFKLADIGTAPKAPSPLSSHTVSSTAPKATTSSHAVLAPPATPNVGTGAQPSALQTAEGNTNGISKLPKNILKVNTGNSAFKKLPGTP